jgi:hypothetical protein
MSGYSEKSIGVKARNFITITTSDVGQDTAFKSLKIIDASICPTGNIVLDSPSSAPGMKSSTK